MFSPPYGEFGYGFTTQGDSATFRLWEVAGTAHLDNCIANLCVTDTGTPASAARQFNAMLHPPTTFQGLACSGPVNAGDEDYVYGAALAQLQRWVLTGRAASAPPLFAGQSVGETAVPAPVLDSRGNVIGGARSPAVDVPVAALTGEPTNNPFPCPLSGTTTPSTQSQLTALYPTHADFVGKWTTDTLSLERQSYLSPQAAANLIKTGPPHRSPDPRARALRGERRRVATHRSHVCGEGLRAGRGHRGNQGVSRAGNGSQPRDRPRAHACAARLRRGQGLRRGP